MKTAIVSFSEEFQDLALNEIRRHLGDIHSSHLACGVYSIHFRNELRLLLEAWNDRPPVYVHHLFPVHNRLEVEASAPDLLRKLRRSLRKTTILRRMDRKKSFAAQVRAVDCFPSVSTNVIAGALENLAAKVTGAKVDLRTPQQVISALLTRDGIWLGLSPTNENVSPWSGGGPPIEPDRDRLNRAEYKLLEALMTFDIRLHPRGHTLDLGAGPGGWTRVLLSKGQRVTAVSPRRLVDGLLDDERVTYHQMSAEDFLSKENEAGKYDFITNDMYLVPQESARLMVHYASLLKEGGQAIVTLKLRCKDWRKVMSHAFRILRCAYIIPRVKHLFFNHKEVTVWLRKIKKKSLSSMAIEPLR